jgi:hypothetical protein
MESLVGSKDRGGFWTITAAMHQLKKFPFPIDHGEGGCGLCLWRFYLHIDSFSNTATLRAASNFPSNARLVETRVAFELVFWSVRSTLEHGHNLNHIS